jgi:three-Cys-motif partner protein
VIDESLYIGREQTLVKHFVLDAYLERFAHKIGSWASAITYVDCFSGPWNAQSATFEDTSFGIAIHQLRRARATYAERGRDIRLRCFFTESSPEAYARLKHFADQITDIEIQTRNLELEAAIPEIVQFTRGAGAGGFTFSFIDPLGWTGFAMDVITPLLQITPGEVLVNFMTDFITRFVEIEDEATSAEFRKMFGTDIRTAVAGRHREDREDVMVAEYMRNLAARGNFPFVASAIVFKPEIESTYFHLVYATRNEAGLEAFKEVEKRMQPVMAAARGTAKARKEESRTGQASLALPGTAYRSTKWERLRERYVRLSQDRVRELLKGGRPLPYDLLWREALARPLVWESDLKEWIKQWQESGRVTVHGLAPKERVPKRNHDHMVVSTSGLL